MAKIGRSVAFLPVLTCILAPPVLLQTRLGEKAHLSINAARPLADAIKFLEPKLGFAISYEDPPYVYRGDVLDKTDPSYRAAHPNARALNPRGGPIEFDVTLPQLHC